MNFKQLLNNSASKIFHFFLTLIFLFIFCNANANGPAANIRGPLKAHASKGNILITSEISTEGNPTVAYALENNVCGASIITQGPLVYNKTTGTYSQTVVVNPGTSEGKFNIKLTVTDAGGSTEVSAGVTIIK